MNLMISKFLSNQKTANKDGIVRISQHVSTSG